MMMHRLANIGRHSVCKMTARLMLTAGAFQAYRYINSDAKMLTAKDNPPFASIRQSMAVIAAVGDESAAVVANGVFMANDLVVFVIDNPDIVDALKKKQLAIRTVREVEGFSKNIDIEIKILEFDQETGVLVARVGSPIGSISPAKPARQLPLSGSEYWSAAMDKRGEFQLSKTFSIVDSVDRYVDRSSQSHASLSASMVSYRTNLQGDGITSGRINFDDNGQCLGVCFSRNESVCVNAWQLYEASQRVARGQPLNKTRMGGTIKTSERIPGVEVFRTQAGGTLDKLGVQIGDTITNLNGFAVRNSADFFRAIGYTSSQNIALTVSREGQELKLGQ